MLTVMMALIFVASYYADKKYPKVKCMWENTSSSIHFLRGRPTGDQGYDKQE